MQTALLTATLVTVSATAGCRGGDNETPASFDPKELALVRVEPGDGQSDVARNEIVRLIFNTIVLPSSVHDQSLRVRTGGTFQTRPEGSFLISANVVQFDPTVTGTGGANAQGFPAGAQILVEVPLFEGAPGQAANNFLQNVEGNPITIASVTSKIAFTTGCRWNDTVPGPPGVLGIDFTPSPNALGQVAANAAVTVIFSEAVDPESVVLGENLFLTNNTTTSVEFQQDIPSITFFDGSLTRYTFLPVFGFGQGPFNVKVNFIDPDAPDTFDPAALPTDLRGNGIQNFTFLGTFDTQFDPNPVNRGVIEERFEDTAQRDTPLTDAVWGTDAEFPFAIVSPPITTRVQNVDIRAILANGGSTSLPDGGGPPNEGRFCTLGNPLIGSDSVLTTGFPPTAVGRRTMNIYRRAELGQSGTIIRAAWGPSFDITTATTYSQVIVRLGHKRPNLDLVPGLMSAEFDVDSFVEVARASNYAVPQSNDINGGMVNDGYFNWPTFNVFFEFDGVNDLLMDVESTEGTATQQIRAFYAVDQTGVLPCNCAAIAANNGRCDYNNSIGQRSKESTFGNDAMLPVGAVGQILNPSPSVQVMQFELARLRSTATSLYYDTGTPAPDFLQPIVGPIVQPCGGQIVLRFSASLDGLVEDVPFVANINACDGFQFIRWEATLRANIFTGSRARIDLLLLPFTIP